MRIFITFVDQCFKQFTMKKNYFNLIITVFVLLYSVQITAQCTFTAAFGGAAINSTVPGSSVTLSTCNFGGEYAPATFNVTGPFIFSSNVSTDYITVTDNSNNVLAFGNTPLSASIPTVGVYRVHFAASGPTTCSVQNTCRVTNVMVPLTACAGAPSSGTVPASYSICPNSSTNITANGATAASGILYQWQQSPNGSTGWVNVTTGSGFTTAALTTASLSALTYYRMIITCTVSSLSATTAVVGVNPNLPIALCYCNTGLGGSGCAGDYITNVSILGTGFNNNSACNSTTLNGTYSYFSPSATTSATLMAGATYSISINTTASNIESLWIDYNQSGTFDAGEHTQPTISSTASVATIASFTVPLTALSGQTGFRVRTRGTGNPNGASDACVAFGSGETEDYVITITPAVGCTGTPNAGTAVASSTLVCAGSPFNLGLSGSTIASGLTYQWQSSPNNITWTAIPGATTAATTRTISASTYFRCIVACSTNTAASVSVQVMLLPAPVAGVISGPNPVNALTVNSYTVSPALGNIQWYQGTTTVGPWTMIAGATSSISSITANPAGVVYYTTVASSAGCVSDTSNAAFTVTVNPMVGDNVCNSILLPLGTTTTKYTVYGCSVQSGEPAPTGGNCSSNITWCNNTLENSRWFRFVAPASGYVSVWAPDFDTQIAVWQASSCGNLLSASTATLIAANDDDPNYLSSGGVQFSSYLRAGCLTPGTTYYIQLDSYVAAIPSDSTRLIVTDMGSPLNASFTGLAATYCQSSTSVSLTPVTSGGTFTQNTSTVTITSFTPSTVGTQTITYAIYGCNTQSTTVVSVCTSIEALSQNNNGVTIYPNPNNGILNVALSTIIGNATLEIIDAVGKTVMETKLTSTDTSVNISELAGGLYIYRIKMNNTSVKQGKLIKE